MKKLNQQQIKNLTTGVTLAAEIKSSCYDLRAFISIFAYQYNELNQYMKMSKYLKTVKDEDIYFVLRKYEVSKEIIRNGWFLSEEDLINSIFIKDINGYIKIENELLKYISDLNILQADWKCDIPV